MIVRSRARAILMPMFLYLASGSASAYLVYNASLGQNGAEARLVYDRETKTLTDQLAGLSDERDRWKRRVDALRNESIDRDLLDQEARAKLDRVAKEDVLIFTGPRPRR